MKEKFAKGLDIAIRSIVCTFINYVMVSMQLSFSSHWVSVLFTATLVWAMVEYGTFVGKLTGKRWLAAALVLLCNAASVAIAWFAGYIHGSFAAF